MKIKFEDKITDIQINFHFLIKEETVKMIVSFFFKSTFELLGTNTIEDVSSFNVGRSYDLRGKFTKSQADDMLKFVDSKKNEIIERLHKDTKEVDFMGIAKLSYDIMQECLGQIRGKAHSIQNSNFKKPEK